MSPFQCVVLVCTTVLVTHGDHLPHTSDSGHHQGSHASVSIGGNTHSYAFSNPSSQYTVFAPPQSEAGADASPASEVNPPPEPQSAPVAEESDPPASDAYIQPPPPAPPAYSSPPVAAAAYSVPSAAYPAPQICSIQYKEECETTYELACVNESEEDGIEGEAEGYNAPQTEKSCAGGEEEICLDILETECTTESKEECREVEETDCAVEPKEVCIVADATTCQDTTFTPSKTSCSEGPERQCESVQTQTCADPEPQQMCAETVQVKCEPDTITTCQTKVSVEVKEECLEFHEPECQDVHDQICYQGYKPETCKVEDQQECKYVTKPCPPGSSRYQCQPTQERICNPVSKWVCKSYGPEDKCHTFNSQKCTFTPNTRCISVPTVVAKEECSSKIVNNCEEVPSTECVTVFTTKCNPIENQEMCFDLPPTCQTEELEPLTNRVCEGQKSDICFNVDSTVCTKTKKNHCFNIPTTSCEKVPVKKCFNIQTPPKLVQIPRKRCVQVPYQACTATQPISPAAYNPY